MPGQIRSTINANPPSNVLVGTTDTVVVAENLSRQGLILTNVSSSTVYLALMGMRSTLHAGIVLLPNGGSWTMDEYNYNNSAINAIAHGAGNILSIQEFIY
ncbi:MAG: hypothetical protein AAB875_02525 [Patescibacteria group bacterium]|mgnify:CR=1 FL=1